MNGELHRLIVNENDTIAIERVLHVQFQKAVLQKKLALTLQLSDLVLHQQCKTKTS